ncbi:hypothetical protein FRZ67_08590 [Panacibacter ginsenosidivorans]|uniref:Uncharacterized protein n=1 Tax=Panacibacter ginsenosidivorans TaxID=1813871 RepID=A0A5B8V7Y9_9BACT|nr:hypothetical protein [Panacibacter ginsenosidivorans]QEC67349.1 hypothetical protein FRZ67_08590 [Panacibacter ginsenosidivorans]
MKKIIFIAFIAFISVSANAQLTNSKWKGTLQLDSPTDIVFDFRTDTLEAIVAADNSSLELMKYSIKDSILSIQKISGQSDCDDSAIAKYKFEINSEGLLLTVIEDGCINRSGVLDNTKWVKE